MKIGITGGIGCGKSFVCQRLENMGYNVIYSDILSKKLMLEDIELGKFLKNNVGNNFILDGKLNINLIGKKIFSDKNIKIKLSEILVPIMNDYIGKFKQENNIDILFVESAIMFQSNFHKIFDYIVCIDADSDIRLNRIMERDKNRTIGEINTIVSNQLLQKDISNMSDFTIINNGDNLDLEIKNMLEYVRTSSKKEDL